MFKDKEGELQDISLWPNPFSLEENLKKERDRITDIIQATKKAFFTKNVLNFTKEKIAYWLDQSRDIYYPPKDNQPSFCKAGLHYSIPDDVVGIGLKVEPEFLNQQEWAVLYHGTKGHNLCSILKDGLIPGGGQAHRGTKDPWGEIVPNGVYFSFWLNQAMGYTIAQNPIILECFVKQVYVAPGCKGYAVSNTHHLSRILIPRKKNRTQQYI